MVQNKGGSTTQGLCDCGNKVASKGKDKQGRTRYKSRCWTCIKRGRRTKGPSCELCGFVAIDPVQLDVDHIDPLGSNTDPSNFQTLCANCHRLKTKQKNDWRKNDKV